MAYGQTVSFIWLGHGKIMPLTFARLLRPGVPQIKETASAKRDRFRSAKYRAASANCSGRTVSLAKVVQRLNDNSYRYDQRRASPTFRGAIRQHLPPQAPPFPGRCLPIRSASRADATKLSLRRCVGGKP
jgi:hypothetical protein